MSKWKDDLKPGDLASACVFNTMFLTLAVADFSASKYAAASETGMAFLAEYVAWRLDMPVFGKVLLGLLMMLPLVLIGMATGVVQFVFGMRKAKPARNAADCIEFGTICFIFFNIATRVAPSQASFIAACPGSKKAGNACLDAFSELQNVFLLMVGLNVIMFILPIVKFAYGTRGEKAD